MRFYFLAIVAAAAIQGVVARAEDPYATILLRPIKLQADAGDDRSTALLKETYSATHAELRVKYNYWQQGIGNADGLIVAIERFHALRLELAPMGDHSEFLRELIAFAGRIEKECEGTKSASKFQALCEIDEAAMKSFRLGAELKLARLGALPGSGK